MKYLYRLFILILISTVINSCATYKTQIKNKTFNTTFPNKKIAHSFYLIGDAGNSPIGTSSIALQYFKEELSKASKNSTAIFLGDNIYENGMPSKSHKNRPFAEHQIDIQTKAVENFKGNTIFIPGNHDWYSGLKGLERQENYVEDILGKDSFLPKNGCPIEKVNINDAIQLIIIDSEWYITDWDKHPTINDKCEIKTRIKFFDELEGYIKKARGKTTIIAVHHPMFTNGSHGGYYSFKSNLSPIPVLGTLKNLIRKTSGISPTDIQNSAYNQFRKRVITLAQENDKVIFVSGHDHNLQYIIKDNIHQIISGSGSKSMATKNVDGEFSSSDPGFTRLDVFSDGMSIARFYSAKTKNIIYQSEVLPSDSIVNNSNEFSSNFPATKKASIYTASEVSKNKFYTKIWGERYRKYFGTVINAPTVNLDTLFGGLKPVSKGGGHQSKSLRLADSKGREYVMRALRKNAVQYLQAVAFKDQYIEGQFNNTFTEALLMDVFTGSHPYAPFTIATLSNAVNIYHTNPTLYYIPKQQTLGHYNSEFGDELYMIEERASSGHGDKSSFGYANKIISTDDLLKNLRKNEKYKVDEQAYIRARLFDMLIGDWDRHEDQWRWAAFEDTNGNTTYKPIPRDRDQAFSIMADGSLLSAATKIIPALRLMKSYNKDIKSTKWFNTEPYPLDIALINNATKANWDIEAVYIQQHLTNKVIDEAFTYFPEEVNDKTIKIIKEKLIGRRANLQKISNNYYKHINKYAVIKGTDNDDWFDIERLPNGKTKVIGYRIEKGKKGTIIHNKTYTKNLTKEIWIYGLDDEDTFEILGKGSQLIKVRLIGGQNKDTYNLKKGKKIAVYDFKSKKSELASNKGSIQLKDDYETNVYNYKKLKNSSNQLIPTLGSNPDDGFKMGFTNTYTLYGFERNPFTQQHKLSAAYYFGTQGYEIAYNAEFANSIGKLNFGLEGVYTSANFGGNFFGYGNTTVNNDDELGLDYNRVKRSTKRIAPSLIWRGNAGANIQVNLLYEAIEVEETVGRYINEYYASNKEVNENFIGAEAIYMFRNRDNSVFPTLGIQTSLNAGFKSNTGNSNSYGYLISSLGFDYKLTQNGQLVLATEAKAHITIGNSFEFYQAATLGGENGLRGYRNERFTGNHSFYQSTDLRFNIRKLKTGILPLNVGIYGGFDYGRLWVNDNLVDDPSYNLSRWNTSVGGGVFFNAADMISATLAAFNSKDGIRIAFTMGFNF